MSGVTKHIYEHDIRDILTMWNGQLKHICEILPRKYSHKDIVEALKKYYPHEWKSVEIKRSYYGEKDEYLEKHGKKSRYNMPTAECLLRRSTQYKKLISSKRREEYAKSYSEETVERKKQDLWKYRQSKIERINKKIERAKEKVQQVTPSYIGQVMDLYREKSQKDKLYILAELKKYYNPKIIRFFFELNDTELNKQLRLDAFYHLQSFNYQPRLRKQKYMQPHTKNKKCREYLKNVYAKERNVIVQTPGELAYRIENSKEQQLKRYDFFISHSYKNHVSVQQLIRYENGLNNDVFCDWINDADYLKRHLLCDATLSVIEKRLEQSDAVIFVDSEESRNSVWCKYELNYFHELGKPIYKLQIQDIETEKYSIELEEDTWFLDEKYKELALIEGSKVRESGL